MAPPASRVDLVKLLERAIKKFDKKSGLPLDKRPFYEPLMKCASASDVVNILEEHIGAFDSFREVGASFRKVVEPIFQIVSIGLETGGETSSVCP